ncbi:unnamed protein product, partial [marine sediment metagenome]
VKAGKLVKLRKARTFFEAEIVKDGKEIEIKVSPAGKVLEMTTEDDDDWEGNIAIDQVPEAVRKTILREAGKHKISEIEQETENGVTVYEVEWDEDGREIEIKVSADGKLLDKETEDDEDDEDNDD